MSKNLSHFLSTNQGRPVDSMFRLWDHNQRVGGLNLSIAFIFSELALVTLFKEECFWV
jgi:hypothetical protein